MRFKMDKEDVELFNLAFIGLGILVIIVIASIVLQPDGYKRLLKFVEITSEYFRRK